MPAGDASARAIEAVRVRLDSPVLDAAANAAVAIDAAIGDSDKLNELLASIDEPSLVPTAPRRVKETRGDHGRARGPGNYHRPTIGGPVKNRDRPQSEPTAGPDVAPAPDLTTD